jgi:sugar lactone lactonase YvrE
MAHGVTSMTADLVLDGRWELGEGPIWDTQTGELLWVDIPGQHVLRYRPGQPRARALPTPLDVGAVAVRRGGGLLAALADGFWVTEPDSEIWTRFAAVEADRPDLRFNDGKCDPSGRFLAGSMAYDKHLGAGGFYRLDPDGTVEQLLDGITISNGLAWTPDGRTLYYIDTPERRIDAFGYDPATGRLSDRSTHIALPDDEPGALDGMTIDVEGGLWVALWGDSRVVRFGPDGRLDVEIAVAASHVTSCTFGGPDLADLYITSAWSELTDAERADQPHAGSLFRARPGVRGYPPVEFAG